MTRISRIKRRLEYDQPHFNTSVLFVKSVVCFVRLNSYRNGTATAVYRRPFDDRKPILNRQPVKVAGVADTLAACEQFPSCSVLETI